MCGQSVGVVRHLREKNYGRKERLWWSSLVFYSQARKIHSPQKGKAKIDWCEKIKCKTQLCVDKRLIGGFLCI